MKKLTLTIAAAVIFLGNYDETAAALDGRNPDSTGSFEETENDEGKKLTFTDANGNDATVVPGDAIVEVLDTDGTFKGYVALDKSFLGTVTQEDIVAPESTDAQPTAEAGTDCRPA